MDSIVTLTVKGLFEFLSAKISESEQVAESKDLSVIDEEAKRQAIELQMAHAQAKVAQGLAISQRIENASELVIEEYYASEAKGNAGVNSIGQGVTLGIQGEGRKITKRVYRFISPQKRSQTATEEVINVDT